MIAEEQDLQFALFHLRGQNEGCCIQVSECTEYINLENALQ